MLSFLYRKRSNFVDNLIAFFFRPQVDAIQKRKHIKFLVKSNKFFSLFNSTFLRGKKILKKKRLTALHTIQKSINFFSIMAYLLLLKEDRQGRR